MSSPSRWPVRIKRGNSTVTIYKADRKKNGHRYREFKLAYHNEIGKRTLQSFNSFKKARKAADNVNVSLMKGEVKSLVLSNDDKVVYLRALKALKSTGTALELSAHQFAELVNVLGGASPLEAARYYIRRHPNKLPRKTVQEVVEEFIDSRRQAKRSEEYVADLEYRLGRFAKAFQTCIADVSQSDVLRFLSGLGLSARSQYNFRKVLRTFFEFAKMQGYLPKDHDDMKGIELGNADPGEIEIYTPKEMRSLLSAAGPVMVPFLAISGFAGLRSKELERLDWAEVQMERGFIELKRSKSKTGQRRLVPILPNLAQWLAPYVQENGRMWLYSDSHLSHLKKRVAEEAGIQWKHNALRHSFASYRLAQIQKANQVAFETGHTVKMLFTNYRELATPDEAKSWFELVPKVGR